MDLNLNQLFYFSIVATNQSYTRAAEQMAVSEPVVHRAVKSLERNIGLKLFQRRGKLVQLTPVGEAIFEYASRIALFANMTQQIIAEQKGPISGRLSVGAGSTLMSSMLPSLLSRWASQHPLVHISVTQGRTGELQQELLEGKLDLAICPGTQWPSTMRRELLFSDKLVIVSAPKQHLSGRDYVSVLELSKEKLILTPRGFSLGNVVEEVERKYGVQFKSVLEVNRLDAVKPLCRTGIGIAVVPSLLVVEEVAQKQLAVLNVEGFPRILPYFAIYRSDRILTPEMKSFLLALQSWAEKRDQDSQDPLRVEPRGARAQTRSTESSGAGRRQIDH